MQFKYNLHQLRNIKISSYSCVNRDVLLSPRTERQTNISLDTNNKICQKMLTLIWCFLCLRWFKPQIFLAWAMTGLRRTPSRKGIVTIFQNWFRNFSSSLDWSVQTLVPDLVVKAGVVIWGVVSIVGTVAADMWRQQRIVVSTEMILSM